MGKLWVFVPDLSAVELDPVLCNFLISRQVSEVFKVVNTFYIPEGIDVLKLPVPLFQQQSAVLGKAKPN